MPIMFHFFRKTQVLMAYGMNFLAQALIYRIDHADAGRLHNEADKGQQGNRLCSNSLFSNA